ncbi:carbohydrate ABC transporter permease [Xylanivirga thermophila]|uniref:carbohydrate ABC transporter permease n=1 Tax=Xylanivirga thermophila TaxID=2496273 RepID=UPI00101DAB15|nr:carbohydrate ABC transporter permease [Xylanivirga thermophila]
MSIKKSTGEKVFNIINVIILTVFSFICLAPVLHVIFASFSDPLKLMRHQGILLRPLGFTLKGYELVFRMPGILTSYGNTLFYVTVGTLINIIMTAISAYVLTFQDWKYVRFLMLMITITMFFSGGLIPTYLQIKKLGLLDTRWALILPGAISVWNLIVMKTSFSSLPKSLQESARIDGASEWGILFKIILPLSKAVMAVMILFYAVGHWNSWFGAMIYLRDRSKYPLQLVLREILVQESQTATVSQFSKVIKVGDLDLYKPLIKYTTIVIATVPVLCFYPFVQKYFVEGVMIGALKG